MTQKRLYVVRVEFEFPVLAESEDGAIEFVDDAVSGLSTLETKASAGLIRFGSKTNNPVLPSGYPLNGLVYGTHEDITLADAVATERSIRDFEKKQMQLL